MHISIDIFIHTLKKLNPQPSMHYIAGFQICLVSTTPFYDKQHLHEIRMFYRTYFYFFLRHFFSKIL